MSLPSTETTTSDALAVCQRMLGQDNVHVGYNNLIHITQNPLLFCIIHMFSASSGLVCHNQGNAPEETRESFDSLYVLEQIIYKLYPKEWLWEKVRG